MIFRILLALVVLAPLPFASVYVWTTSLIAVVVGILLLLWSAERLLSSTVAPLGGASTWPFFVPYGFVVLWVGVQASPWTPDFMHALSWGGASAALGETLGGTISLNPDASLTALTSLLIYGGVFWLSLHYCRERANAHRVVVVVTYAGFVYAAYGLWVYLSGSQSILFFNKFAYLGDLTSTFVNRNSYATFAGLGLLCASAQIVRSIVNILEKPFGRTERLRQIIEALTEQYWLVLLAWIALMAALLMTHSRAGFASTVLALVVYIVLVGRTRFVHGRSVLYLSAAFVIATGVFFSLAGENLDRRLNLAGQDSVSRFEVYKTTAQEIQAHPFVGTGYGTFAEVFELMRSQNTYKDYLKAHNTYLENILELGLPAALALFSIFVTFLVMTYRGLRHRQSGTLYPCLGFSATVLVAAHSLVDFSLQIPAVAMTYSLIMGAACAQSWSSRKQDDPW